MCATNLLPLGNVGYEHARAHHNLQARASLAQSGFDVLECLHSLEIRIANPHESAVRPGSRSSCHIDVTTNSDSPRVTNDRLPRCTTGNVLSLHEIPYVIGDS